jgi:hypothetical protein
MARDHGVGLSRAFDRFREEKLLPAFRELAGDEAPPAAEPEVNPVHKLIAR